MSACYIVLKTFLVSIDSYSFSLMSVLNDLYHDNHRSEVAFGESAAENISVSSDFISPDPESPSPDGDVVSHANADSGSFECLRPPFENANHPSTGLEYNPWSASHCGSRSSYKLTSRLSSLTLQNRKPPVVRRMPRIFTQNRTPFILAPSLQ